MARPIQSGVSLGAPAFTMTPFRIGDGDAGVTATIKKMQSITFGSEGVGNPHVRAAALDAVRGVQRGMDEITSIFEWVKRNIEFRGEYSETLQTPLVTLQLGAGDCDDHTTLLAAMYESLGFETRFNTVSTGGVDDEFSHVFPEVKDKSSDRWLAVDSTVGGSYPGWKSPTIGRQKIRSAAPAAMRGRGILHDLFWLGLGLVASNWVLGKRR